MSNLYRLLLLVVFAIYSTPVLAQTNAVRGQVLDQNNKPLPGANIVLKNTRLGAVTDNQGQFLILNVPI